MCFFRVLFFIFRFHSWRRLFTLIHAKNSERKPASALGSMLAELPNGSLQPAPCPSSSLRILIGDSIDRELVRTRCSHPVLYDPQRCAKCVLCNPARCGEDAWLNVMTFGLGIYGCDHVDQHWAPNKEARGTSTRIQTLLRPLLASKSAATYGQIVLSLHSGAWDVLATKECRNISHALLAAPNVWFAAAQAELMGAVDGVLATAPPTVARLVQRPLLWRTAPLICRSFAGGEDASELFVAVSALGVQFACRASLQLVDWRSLSCRRFHAGHLLADGTHYVTEAYDAMAREMREPSSTRACGAVQPRCECQLCTSYTAFSWRLGRLGTPCNTSITRAHAPAASLHVDRGTSGKEGNEAKLASSSLSPAACLAGLLPSRPAPIALFSLAAYQTLGSSSSSGWMDAAVLSWRSNANLLHAYLLATAPPPPHWTGAASNIVVLRFASIQRLFTLLLEFADIPPSKVPLFATRPPRAASFAPLLPSFSEAKCSLDLTSYAYFGTVELDVVLGDLAPFIAPYIAPPGRRSATPNTGEANAHAASGTVAGTGAEGPHHVAYDAIALRWAPPSRQQWRSADDAVAFNTLADVSFGAVPLSTPLLIIRNNATTRLWWRQAEQWLRTQEVAGAYSLRKAVTCQTCTGPHAEPRARAR